MNNVIQTTLKLTLALGLATGLATSAQASVAAKNRYLVIYKSQQGHMAMESFMQNEAGRAYGLKSS